MRGRPSESREEKFDKIFYAWHHLEWLPFLGWWPKLHKPHPLSPLVVIFFLTDFVYFNIAVRSPEPLRQARKPSGALVHTPPIGALSGPLLFHLNTQTNWGTWNSSAHPMFVDSRFYVEPLLACSNSACCTASPYWCAAISQRDTIPLDHTLNTLIIEDPRNLVSGAIPNPALKGWKLSSFPRAGRTYFV